jgi:hypothetical protein
LGFRIFDEWRGNSLRQDHRGDRERHQRCAQRGSVAQTRTHSRKTPRPAIGCQHRSVAALGPINSSSGARA